VIALVDVGGGKLALTHRPKKTDPPEFRAAGVTHLVTLLTEREGAKDVGALATKAGLTWIWCPLDGANVKAPVEAVRDALDAAASALRAGGAVVVHCSAGIHRTGMFGYALVRLAGLDRDAARAKLRELRAVTADDVGDERLAWGDRIAEALTSRTAGASP